MTLDVRAMQAAIDRAGVDGWLFCDAYDRDPVAARILGLSGHASRRWFYLVPRAGEPRRLVHAVEPARLDALPGSRRVYGSWRALDASLAWLLDGVERVAMHTSVDIPAVSLVDAGLVDRVRACGVDVADAADLIQRFDGLIDEAGYESHCAAADTLLRIKDEAFAAIADGIRRGTPLTEHGAQRLILERIAAAGLTTDGDTPIVAVNANPANPHYAPPADGSPAIVRGDRILIDLWARSDRPRTIFADFTWIGFAGAAPPDAFVEAFEAVRDARDAAIAFVGDRFAAGESCAGWEVDDACRAVIDARGYGEHFVHRTGHSIGERNHGFGVNLDNLETRDTRTLIPGVCCSVEPGIYIDGVLGVRSETDIVVRPGPTVTVTGDVQRSIVCLDV